MTHRLDVLLDRATAPLYEAVIEATEEAIVNALLAAETTSGRAGRVAHALDPQALAEVLRTYGRLPGV
jgi:D-aminopeptidase